MKTTSKQQPVSSGFRRLKIVTCLLILALFFALLRVPDRFVHHSDNLQAVAVGLVVGVVIILIRKL